MPGVNQVADRLELRVLLVDRSSGAGLESDPALVDEADQANPIPLDLEQPALVIEWVLDQLRLHRLEGLRHRAFFRVGEVDQPALALFSTARPDGVLPLFDLFLGAPGLDRRGEGLDVEVGIRALVLLLDQEPVFLRAGPYHGVASTETDALETEFHFASTQRFGGR